MTIYLLLPAVRRDLLLVTTTVNGAYFVEFYCSGAVVHKMEATLNIIMLSGISAGKVDSSRFNGKFTAVIPHSGL